MKQTIWCFLAVVVTMTHGSVWASTFEVCRPDAAAQCIQEFQTAMYQNFYGMKLADLQGGLLQNLAKDFATQLQRLQEKTTAMRDLDAQFMTVGVHQETQDLVTTWRANLRALEKDHQALAQSLYKYIQPLTEECKEVFGTGCAHHGLKSSQQVQTVYHDGMYRSQVIVKTWFDSKSWLGHTESANELSIELIVDPFVAEVCLRDAQANGICSQLDLLNDKPAASYVAISANGVHFNLSSKQMSEAAIPALVPARLDN